MCYCACLHEGICDPWAVTLSQRTPIQNRYTAHKEKEVPCSKIQLIFFLLVPFFSE